MILRRAQETLREDKDCSGQAMEGRQIFSPLGFSMVFLVTQQLGSSFIAYNLLTIDVPGETGASFPESLKSPSWRWPRVALPC